MIRQPVGVVAAIAPFNFPTMIPVRVLPFAVAAGNAFILDPPSRTRSPANASSSLPSCAAQG
jgi:malonate-semialdehyde dehydrogenase (acetylating) / methylmalonate-semialdehyde dehydrogenase